MRIKRMMSAILAALMLFSIMPLAAQASEWGEGDTLEDALSQLKVGFADTLLDWLMLPSIGVVQQRYTYFMFKNERTGTIDEHPVYCVDPTKFGAYDIVRIVGPNPDDGSNTATYIRGDKVGDARYKAILAAGYPHVRYEGLGLQNLNEAYYATKTALWMYVRGNDPSKLSINPKYGNDDPAAKRVRDAAIHIYTTGMAYYTAEPKLTLTGRPSATAKLDATGEYYVQGIEVYTNGWVGTNPDVCGDVQLKWDSPPPSGTIVLGSNGEDISSTLNVKLTAQTTGTAGYYGSVTVKYPAAATGADTFTPPTLKAEAILPNDEIYVAYAQAGKDTYQRYLVERDPKALLTAAFVSQVTTPTKDFPEDTGLRIRKIETGTNAPLAGAVFEVRNPEGKLIYSLATDASGIIDIPLYIVGNYTVTETVPPQYHLLPDNRTQSVTVRYNEVAEVTFADDPYGTLRVIKRDAADGRPLGGASIRIKNIITNTTQERVTDSSGSAVFDRLPTGAYEIVELTSPAGYALDSTPHTVNVVPLSEGETSYTLTNKANPGLRIIKFDRQTMMPIAGVTFEIYHDGELYGSYVTDAWGEIELRNIPAGTYTAKETATVAPYVLDPTAQWVEIKAGQGHISELIFFNLVKPGIHILKIDSETFAPLPNARFLVSKVGDTFSKEYTTDANGEINLAELDPGAYEIVELTAPDGFLIDDATRTIQVNAGENAQFVFTNTLKPSLEVLKWDGESYVPGATFRIAKIEDGSNYLDRITDTNGRIRIDGLEPGIYSVREVSPPTGYVLNTTEYHVELFPGRLSTVVVPNLRKPNLQIVKTDANTGAPIGGVTFTVRKVDSATISTVSTDAIGEAWLYALDPGVYEVTEQSVPEPYLLDTRPQFITLEPGRTGMVRFQNYPKPDLYLTKTNIGGEPIPGAVFSLHTKSGILVGDFTTDKDGKIHAYHLNTGYYIITEKYVPAPYILDPTPKEIYFVEGKTTDITIQNHRKPDLTIEKIDSITGDPVKGAKFQVWYAPNSLTGSLRDIGQYYTDENGQFSLPRLDVGWYRVTELEPASGYGLKAPSTLDVFMEADKDKTISFENIPLSALALRKIDSDTGLPVPGAAFRVRYLGGTSGSGGTIIFDGVTSANGTIVLTGLAAGTYIAEEYRAAPGYELSNPSSQTAYLSGREQDVVELVFSNAHMGSLVIKKLDSVTKQPVKGVIFKVTDSSGGGVGPSNGEYTTDAEGLIHISEHLPVGSTVVVQEISCPDNYVMDTTAQTVKIQENTAHVLTFYNTPKGGLLITKKDAQTLSPLAGVVFKVAKSDGTVVGAANGQYTTDANGSIRIPGLSPGTYLISELRARDGYLLDDTVKSVEIKDSSLYTVEFLNTPVGGLKIVKLDEDTRAVLRGASFEVRRMNGELIGTYITNASGIITIPGIGSGWFTATEVRPPDGYRLDSAPRSIEVKDGKTAVLEITNKKTASLMIQKTDSVTGKGIYGVTFILYDANKSPIMQLVTDQSGYAYADKNLTAGRHYLRELVPAEGYEPDDEWKTVYIEAGKTTHVEWENKPVMAQIQIVKYAQEYNPVTGAPAGSLLPGAVFEITRARSGVVVQYITTDARGVAASEPLPLGRYFITEVTAPPYYQLSGDRMEAELEYSGQIIRLSAYNKSANLGTEIKKTGNIEVVAGDSMRYDISIANTSNVPLSDFYWSDRLPTDAARIQTLTTGTYNQRLYYRIVYKTNYSEYRVLASNLLSTNNYSYNLSANALGLLSGEAVTGIRLEFGTVAPGFASVTKPTITVQTLPALVNGYQVINRCEAAGQYGGAPQISTTAWATTVIRFGPVPSAPSLPKTGY